MNHAKQYESAFANGAFNHGAFAESIRTQTKRSDRLSRKARMMIFCVAVFVGAAIALVMTAGCQISHASSSKGPTQPTTRNSTTQPGTASTGYVQPDADDLLNAAKDAGSTGGTIGAVVGAPIGQGALGGLIGTGIGSLFGIVYTLVRGKQSPTTTNGTLNVIHTIAQDAQQFSPILGALGPNGAVLANTIGATAGAVASATNINTSKSITGNIPGSSDAPILALSTK